jgi:LmbE family N-acetylglucosaminyl deacetylase
MALRTYLSPHLDDAVFSCGGLIAQQAAAGDEVRVVTVCAGDPPVGELTPFAYELHRRWGGAGSPVGLRRAEDHVACGRIGASVVHLPVPDAIYRRSPGGEARYPDLESLFAGVARDETDLVEEVTALLEKAVPPDAELYAPLGVGGHVDHLVARQAVSRMKRSLWFYRDLPYALRPESNVAGTVPPGGTEAIVTLAPEEIATWATASGEYHSQLSSFWPDYEAMEGDLRAFHDRFGGIPLVRLAAGDPWNA